MSANYDLVIIGYTATGIYAAMRAARQQARVALVEQNCQPTFFQHQAFSRIGQTLQQIDHANQFQIFEAPIPQSRLRWSEVNRWIDEIEQTQQEVNSVAKLSSLGIDFISGAGAFFRKPRPGFAVGDRLLRSRAYLITTDYQTVVPDILGLKEAGYVTPEKILEKPPASLMVLGDDPIGVELAQLYSRLGTQVTIVLRQPRILANLEPETAFLVQAQLEAEGVRVVSATQAPQVSIVGAPQFEQAKIQAKKQVQVGSKWLQADEILLATGWQPNTESLNLEAISPVPVQINSRLQTMHPSIYWCGHPVASIARHQAEIAVKNALFLPFFKTNYHHIAQSVLTEPELAWVGLTESQALHKYGSKKTISVSQPLSPLLKAQLEGKTTGLCKIITRDNGEILGAHVVGAQASELIGTISLAIQQKIKIQNLDRLSVPSPSFSEVFRNVANEWRHRHLQRNTMLQNFWQGYFAWQRSRIR